MAGESRRTGCLQAGHDHIDDFADETIRQRQVPQQQAMLGRVGAGVTGDRAAMLTGAVASALAMLLAWRASRAGDALVQHR